MYKLLDNVFDEIIEKIKSDYSLDRVNNMNLDNFVYEFFGCALDIKESDTLIDILDQFSFPFFRMYKNNRDTDAKFKKMSFGLRYDDKAQDYFFQGKSVNNDEIDKRAIQLIDTLNNIIDLLNKVHRNEIKPELFNIEWTNLPLITKLYLSILYDDMLFFDLDLLNEVSAFFNEKHHEVNTVFEAKVLINELKRKFKSSIFNISCNYLFFMQNSNSFSFTPNDYSLINYNDHSLNIRLEPKVEHYNEIFKLMDFNKLYFAFENRIPCNFQLNNSFKDIILTNIHQNKNIFSIEYQKSNLKPKTKKNGKSVLSQQQIEQLLKDKIITQYTDLKANSSIDFDTITVFRINQGCANHDHIKTLVKIPYLENENIMQTSINAYYCLECSKYFTYYDTLTSLIPEKEWSNLIIEIITSNVAQGGLRFENKESLIHKLGYNVDKVNQLTSLERQMILYQIITHRIRNIAQVEAHINQQIIMFSNNSSGNYELAIKKWREDRDFVNRL